MDNLLGVGSDLNLLSTALKACVIGVVIADAQQRDFPVVYVNPAFERLSGYPADEIVGRNCRFFRPTTVTNRPGRKSSRPLNTVRA